MSAPNDQFCADLQYDCTSLPDPSMSITGQDAAVVHFMSNTALQEAEQAVVPTSGTLQRVPYACVSIWPVSASDPDDAMVSDTTRTAQAYHRQRWEMLSASRALYETHLRLTDLLGKSASVPELFRSAYTQRLADLLDQYENQYNYYITATTTLLPTARQMLNSQPDEAVIEVASKYYHPNSSKVYRQLSGELLVLMSTPASNTQPLKTLVETFSDRLLQAYEQGKAFAKELGVEWRPEMPTQALSALASQQHQ